MLPLAARCRVGSLTDDDYALLDTGAQWSIVGGELAELVDSDLGEPTEPVTIHTRLGDVTGTLRRLGVTLVADEGENLEVDGTVCIAPEWTGPVVLGVRGFLERVRVALDPGVADDDQWLSFGGIR